MSYRLPTPGRAYHLRNIWRTDHSGDSPLPAPPSNISVQEDDEFFIPNDRGALIQPGSTRLPLDRHLCASTLWSFFHLCSTNARASEAACELGHVLLALQDVTDEDYQHLLSITRRNLHNVDYAASEEFLSLHGRVLRGKTHITISETLYAIFALYAELEARGVPRPRGIKPGDWLLELQRKKAAKWVQRPEDHRLRADVCFRLAIGAARDQRFHDAAWYSLRALIELAPWWPTEYYLASWEAALPQVQLFVQTLAHVSLICLCFGNHSMAYTFAATMANQPFVDRDGYMIAMKVQWKCIDAEPLYLSQFCDNRALLDDRETLRGDIDNDRHPRQQIKSVRRNGHPFEIVYTSSFARDFTPYDVVVYHDTKGRELHGDPEMTDDYSGVPDDPSRACHCGSCNDWSIVQQKWIDGKHEHPEPYCWTIEEETRQLNLGQTL